MDSREITFRFDETMNGDDPVARWITIVSLAWNDITRKNARLLAGLQCDETPAAYNVHHARQVAAAVWEFLQFLEVTKHRTSAPEKPAKVEPEEEQLQPKVALPAPMDEGLRAFFRNLPSDAIKTREQLLELTSPDRDNSWFRARLARARNMTYHSPDLDSKDLKKALARLADKQEIGTIETAGKIVDFHIDYADTVAALLLLMPEDPDDSRPELERFITDLRDAVMHLTTFVQQVLATFIGTRKEQFTMREGESMDDAGADGPGGSM